MAFLSPIVELRQYTMVPGRRDDFARLFDAEFIESQQALGIAVIGQFRDLDRDDRYVWMRGFADMEARRAALTSFYEGPVWAEHRDAANATMTEWHDVLLLRPIDSRSGFQLDMRARPVAEGNARGIVLATIVPVAAERVNDAADGFATTLAPALAASDAELLGSFVTATAANTYPRLPVREEASVLVWFTRPAEAEAQGVDAVGPGADANWRSAWRDVLGCEPERAQTLRLAPTGRSLLH